MFMMTKAKVVKINLSYLLLGLIIGVLLVVVFHQQTSCSQKLYGLNRTVVALLHENENLTKRTWDLQNRLSTCRAEYLSKEKELSRIIDEMEEENSMLQEKLANLSTAYESLKAQKGLVNPTFYELASFIHRDRTDRREYIEDKFTCVDFANTFIKNFAREGFYSCLAYAEFEDTAHAIVVVNTTDIGLVYVEPQEDDVIFNLKEGDDYCEKVNWDCSWEIKRIVSCFS